MKRTRIAAIDAGASKVSTVMADRNGNGDLRILGIGTAPSSGLEKGIVVDARQAAASVSQSVRKAEKMAGYKLKSAYVGVSGTNMSSLNNHGVISIPRNDQVVHAADRKRVLEVAQSVEVPSNQRLLHVIPRAYSLDEQRNINNPVGMHGFRLNVETHIVTATTTSVQSLTKCVMSMGVGIEGLVLKSLASAEAVLTEDERQDGVVLADIGGDTTEIAVFKDGSVCHTSTLPVGGYHITNDVSIGLGLPFDLAEVIKKKYGNAIAPENGSYNITEDNCSISYDDLCQVINARLEELFRLILLQIPQTDYARTIPSGLVLTGGSCNLAGIAELGQAITRLPVRVGTPVSSNGNDAILRDPAYATSVGLLYWEINSQSSRDSWASRNGFGVLLPRWLSYFSYRNSNLNIQSKEKEHGENQLRA